MAKRSSSGSADKRVVGFLLLLNWGVNLAVLGLASWAINGLVDGTYDVTGNAASILVIPTALIAGVVGIAAAIAGSLALLYSWSTETIGVSLATGLVALLLSFLNLGFATKEIRLGGDQATELKALEGLVIALAGTQFFYVVSLMTHLY